MPCLGFNVLQVYCLPDGYEVVERSLDDIRYVLNPTFTAQEIARLDKVSTL
jgi:U4/U6.U5 tri-snRNP-associated protein 2